MKMGKFSGFYRLSPEERLRLVKQERSLTGDETKVLTDSGALEMGKADRAIENVIGAVHLPLGIATNFVINGKETLVPMAVEEPSVVAAASRAAKQTLPDGFKAEADESIMIGQVQITGIEDINTSLKNLEVNKKEVLNKASEYMKHVEQYGCGARDFGAKAVQTDRGAMIIVNFHINVGNAQGANMVNTTLEGVSPILEQLTEGKAKLRIVSNLASERKAKASAVWKKELVGKAAIEGVLDAHEFAKRDIYRCSTHNKGIMNGIDAVAVATGNDWRSVEAGAHTFAAMGRYQPLTHYYKNENGDLVGEIELPLAVATVGPAISSSPTAGTSLKIMDVGSSQELAMVMASVGLANNFAALSALGTVGIQKGHMKLHARNIAAYAGARTNQEIDRVAEILTEEKNFNVERAKEVLERVREE
ncbi:hydroxymethylglutaryl-CoA reductase, degradative [Candidatus Micrarchaeota archaeon]|nr:hydroxymethylglutaryl-CoA reductase, degradative [Candidatus Micrarchaeota archaeon]